MGPNHNFIHFIKWGPPLSNCAPVLCPWWDLHLHLCFGSRNIQIWCNREIICMDCFLSCSGNCLWCVFFWMSSFCEANVGRYSLLLFTASWCGSKTVSLCLWICVSMCTGSWGVSCFHFQLFQVRFSMLPWEPVLSVLLSYRRKAQMMEAYRIQTQRSPAGRTPQRCNQKK